MCGAGCAGRARRIVLGSLLAVCGTLPAAGSARGTAAPPGCQGEQLWIRRTDGSSLSALLYRSGEAPSAALVLVAPQRADSVGCGAALVRSACQGGREVLVPRAGDGGGLGRAGGSAAGAAREWLAHAIEARRLLDLLAPSVETVDVVCVGAAGWAIPLLLRADPRIGQVAWVAPQGQPAQLAAFVDETPATTALLLVASLADEASSALAGELFRRFNERAELRLLSRGGGGCDLLADARAAVWLGEWLWGAATPGDGRGESQP